MLLNRKLINKMAKVMAVVMVVVFVSYMALANY